MTQGLETRLLNLSRKHAVQTLNRLEKMWFKKLMDQKAGEAGLICNQQLPNDAGPKATGA